MVITFSLGKAESRRFLCGVFGASLGYEQLPGHTHRSRREIQGVRVLQRMTAGLVALLLFGGALETASAQAPYPNRPIRIVVPFGPGGFADITMRLAGQGLSERTGQQVVIENRPSAGGIVAGNAVTAAQPDGYTLFVMSSGIALSKSLIKTMPFDPETAFAPISTVAMFDNMILVRADSPLRTTQDVLTMARANPATFNIATINPGSTQNVTAELIRFATGIPMTIIPHRTTAEVLTSLLRGDTQIGVESYAALKSPIDSGSIRAIAGSGSKRSPMQPSVSTLLEHGVNAAVDGWNSLVAPAGTPKEIIDVLNGHIRSVVQGDDFKRRMLDLGGEPNPSTPEELAARLKSDIAMWADVVKKAGLEPR
jgi:putative tricarboxylic transport membrane protein